MRFMANRLLYRDKNKILFFHLELISISFLSLAQLWVLTLSSEIRGRVLFMVSAERKTQPGGRNTFLNGDKSKGTDGWIRRQFPAQI